MKTLRIRCTLLVLAAAVSACTLKEDNPGPPGPNSGPPPIPAPADVAAPPANALRTPSGLASKILRAGLGSMHPTTRHRVTVLYTGWTPDGKMFDSSSISGGPITFVLTEVIAGWTEALQLMVVGEKRRFWIPGHLGYDTLPPGSGPTGMLVFEIELLDIK